MTQFLSAPAIAALHMDRVDRQNSAAAFRASADTIEAICEWLADVWDHFPDEIDDDKREQAVLVRTSLEAALAPWRGEILAHARIRRVERRNRNIPLERDLSLFGATLPARAGAP